LTVTERLAPATPDARALEGRRILIIVENLPVPFDRRVWQEARALRDAGARVTVICPATKEFPRRRERLEDIDIFRHPMPEEGARLVGYLSEYIAALFWETVLAWRVFFNGGFDAIHACNPPDLIFLVGAPFKLLGKKFVFDHHDINPELFEAKFGKQGLLWRGLRFMERLTFATADMSIATNESYKAIATSRGGMDPAKVTVVRSAPDLRKVQRAPPNARWRNGRRFLVGYVGVMGEQEGIDLLLDAVGALVARGRTDVQFCLIGSGSSLADLRARCNRMGLDPYVTFTGRAPDADLFEMLSTADVCVNSDRVNPMNDKSTMNKIIEYMAFGKPMVQFEVVEGRFSAGESSLYARPNDPIDMADKIEQLLDSEDERARMGALGLARVASDLAWEHQAPKLVAAYARLFSRDRASVA
jgi:glycosyltransferase involved in cell wall biosynthesis